MELWRLSVFGACLLPQLLQVAAKRIALSEESAALLAESADLAFAPDEEKIVISPVTYWEGKQPGGGGKYDAAKCSAKTVTWKSTTVVGKRVTITKGPSQSRSATAYLCGFDEKIPVWTVIDEKFGRWDVPEPFLRDAPQLVIAPVQISDWIDTDSIMGFPCTAQVCAPDPVLIEDGLRQLARDVGAIYTASNSQMEASDFDLDLDAQNLPKVVRWEATGEPRFGLVQQDPSREVTLQPGTTALKFERSTGKITVAADWQWIEGEKIGPPDVQIAALEVEVGWRIRSVNGVPYSNTWSLSLDSLEKPVTVIFDTPPMMQYQVLDVTDGGTGLGGIPLNTMKIDPGDMGNTTKRKIPFDIVQDVETVSPHEFAAHGLRTYPSVFNGAATLPRPSVTTGEVSSNLYDFARTMAETGDRIVVNAYKAKFTNVVHEAAHLYQSAFAGGFGGMFFMEGHTEVMAAVVCSRLEIFLDNHRTEPLPPNEYRYIWNPSYMRYTQSVVDIVVHNMGFNFAANTYLSHVEAIGLTGVEEVMSFHLETTAGIDVTALPDGALQNFARFSIPDDTPPSKHFKYMRERRSTWSAMANRMTKDKGLDLPGVQGMLRDFEDDLGSVCQHVKNLCPNIAVRIADGDADAMLDLRTMSADLRTTQGDVSSVYSEPAGPETRARLFPPSYLRTAAYLASNVCGNEQLHSVAIGASKDVAPDEDEEYDAWFKTRLQSDEIRQGILHATTAIVADALTPGWC